MRHDVNDNNGKRGVTQQLLEWVTLVSKRAMYTAVEDPVLYEVTYSNLLLHYAEVQTALPELSLLTL